MFLKTLYLLRIAFKYKLVLFYSSVNLSEWIEKFRSLAKLSNKNCNVLEFRFGCRSRWTEAAIPVQELLFYARKKLHLNLILLFVAFYDKLRL